MIGGRNGAQPEYSSGKQEVANCDPAFRVVGEWPLAMDRYDWVDRLGRLGRHRLPVGTVRAFRFGKRARHASIFCFQSNFPRCSWLSNSRFPCRTHSRGLNARSTVHVTGLEGEVGGQHD